MPGYIFHPPATSIRERKSFIYEVCEDLASTLYIVVTMENTANPWSRVFHKNWQKVKPSPLKQKLTRANHGVYVATSNVVRYVINNMLAKKQKFFPAANPMKVILLAHFISALTLYYESQRRKSMWVCCVARRVAANSLPVSMKTIIQKRRIFQCCNGCSLRLDLLILFLNLFAFSALVSAFQFFTRKHCLQFSGLNMCGVTLT